MKKKAVWEEWNSATDKQVSLAQEIKHRSMFCFHSSVWFSTLLNFTVSGRLRSRWYGKLWKVLGRPQVVWESKAYFSGSCFSGEKNSSIGVFSKYPPDLAAPGKIFISCWHFLNRSFLLCKHEAEKPSFSWAQRHRNMNYSGFIWTCEPRIKHTNLSFWHKLGFHEKHYKRAW